MPAKPLVAARFIVEPFGKVVSVVLDEVLERPRTDVVEGLGVRRVFDEGSATATALVRSRP